MRQSLGGKERDIYFRLIKRVPPESIMVSVGVKFGESFTLESKLTDEFRSKHQVEFEREKDRQPDAPDRTIWQTIWDGSNLTDGFRSEHKAEFEREKRRNMCARDDDAWRTVWEVSNVSGLCRDARESTVNAQRKVEAGLDVLAAMKDSGADPKTMYRMIFGHARDPWAPASDAVVLDWNGIGVIHSVLGPKFMDFDRESLRWLGMLPLKHVYASEWEKVDPVLTLLESPEGRLLVEHLHRCRATPCRCAEGKERLNCLIGSATRWRRKLEIDFEIHDTLTKEDRDDVKFRFVKTVTDIYSEFMEIEVRDEAKRATAPEKRKPGTSGSR
ncbi:Uncharacterised protein [uncultured archaeon]|nr:Uncharacterised protein [uncultured archaeon]